MHRLNYMPRGAINLKLIQMNHDWELYFQEFVYSLEQYLQQYLRGYQKIYERALQFQICKYLKTQMSFLREDLVIKNKEIDCFGRNDKITYNGESRKGQNKYKKKREQNKNPSSIDEIAMLVMSITKFIE